MAALQSYTRSGMHTSHRIGRAGWGSFWAACIILLACVGRVIYSQSRGETFGVVFCTVAGIMALIAGVCLAYWAARSRILLLDDRVEIDYAFGGKRVIFNTEMRAVEGVFSGHTYTYVLYAQDGRKYEINPAYERFEALLYDIRRRTGQTGSTS